MSNFHSICNNATNPCYLLQTRLVVTHKYYTNLPLADHLIHYTTESKAPCSNPKGTLRTAERKRKTFIINHHQTCDSDWYSESQNLLYKLSLYPPPEWKPLCCVLYAIELNQTFVRLLLWYATKSYVRPENASEKD